MYLLVITNKSSNILEDLDTLRLLAKLVPDYAHPIDDDGVAAAAFDLLFAFDEAVSLGHREAVTPAQVRAACEMESHEERLHKMVIESKVADTRDLMKRKAAEIERAKLEQRVGGGSQSGGEARDDAADAADGRRRGERVVRRRRAGRGFGGGGGVGALPRRRTLGALAAGSGGPLRSLLPRRERLPPAGPAGARKRASAWGRRRGRLGGGRGGRRRRSRGRPRGGSRRRRRQQAGGVAARRGRGDCRGGCPPRPLRRRRRWLLPRCPPPRDDGCAFPAPASGEPLTVALDERVSASLSRDGGLEAPLEVQGTLSLAVHDEAAARVVLSVDTSTSDSSD